MNVVQEETLNGQHIRYMSGGELTRTTTVVTIPKRQLVRAAQIAQRWVRWDRPALALLATCSFGYETLVNAERELLDAVRRAMSITTAEYTDVKVCFELLQKVTAAEFDPVWTGDKRLCEA